MADIGLALYIETVFEDRGRVIDPRHALELAWDLICDVIDGVDAAAAADRDWRDVAGPPVPRWDADKSVWCVGFADAELSGRIEDAESRTRRSQECFDNWFARQKPRLERVGSGTTNDGNSVDS